MAVVSQCQANEVCRLHVSSLFTNTRSSVSGGRAKSPERAVYENQESESDGLVLIFTNVPSSHPQHPEPYSFDNEPDQVDPDSPSESENLATASLSSYDCDSEGGGSGDDADSEDSDFERRGSRNPGAINLKFQLDAVKAGKCRGVCMMPTL